LVVAVLTSVPVVAALSSGEWAFAGDCGLVIVLLALIGGPLALLESPKHIQINEAMVVIVLSFVLGSLVMAFPLARTGLTSLDAVFESISAVTTTGLTTLGSVDNRGVAFQFTRSWVQWYGGLGFVVFSVALLVIEPGMGARRLVSAESEGQDLEVDAHAQARRVLVAYLVLTAVGVSLLWALGVGAFAALVHTLSAVSTGGFSLYDDSLAGLGGVLVQTAAMLVAFSGALALPLYYRAYRRGWSEVWRDLEFRGLVGAVGVTAAVLGMMMAVSGERSWGEILHHGTLSALSAQTGTGFSTFAVAELDPASKLVLILSMLIGGSSGSSAGGIKILRLLILLRLFQLLILRTRVPRHAVVEPWLGDERLDDREIERGLLIIVMFVLALAFSWMPFLALGYPPLDSLFEVVSATATVGLSTGITGQALEPGLKAVLCFDMLLGRVEILALLVVLFPGTWLGRRNTSS
jgi:trk system potassium uptake protein TrkH